MMQFCKKSVLVASLVTLAVLAAMSSVAQATGLVANWTFNQPTGSTTISDASGNGHTATLVGTDTLQSIPGQIGTGLMFNGVAGTGNYLSVPDARDYFSGENKLTVSCWVYWPANTGDTAQARNSLASGTTTAGRRPTSLASSIPPR